jgi:hypothetical protein
MDLSPLQQRQVLVRLITKASNGTIDSDGFLDAIVAARAGEPATLTSLIEAEVIRWRLDLGEAKTQTEAQVDVIDSELTALPMPAEWVQPTGAHDAYNIGDFVTFEGQVWESVIDGNVWSPTVHPDGWRLIG